MCAPQSRDRLLGLTVHQQMIDKVIVCASVRAAGSFYRAFVLSQTPGSPCLAAATLLAYLKPVYCQHFTHSTRYTFLCLCRLPSRFLRFCVVSLFVDMVFMRRSFPLSLFSQTCHSNTTGAMKQQWL